MAVKANGYAKWIVVLAIAVCGAAVGYGQLIGQVGTHDKDIVRLESKDKELEDRDKELARSIRRMNVLIERICVRMDIPTKVVTE